VLSARLEDLVEQAGEAVDGANRVRNIVKDLKTFARAEEERNVPVSLRQVIETAINMSFNEIKYRARLIKEYGKTPTIMANDGRLSQVFLNLLVNAAHAIDEGDVDNNRIRVRTWTENDQVLAEVRDTGRGIEPKNLGRLFDPFFTTKPAGVGSGLGLSICHKIITDHGGRIEVRSEPDRGTCFTVRLPVTTPEAEKSAGDAAAQQKRTVAVRGRILVVDDEPVVARATRRVLAREHEVVTATSGQEARDALEREGTFDAVVSDLMMPDITGMDLHAWLDERDPDLARRMVFLTGGAFTPGARRFLERVPNARFEKPVDSKNLLEVVRNLVIQHRRTDPE
jgi:CheY-like chemotaxis protein